MNLEVSVIKEIVNNTLKDVLSSLYEPFWIALIVAFLSMFFYKALRQSNFKSILKEWGKEFKSSSEFRRVFFLAMYVMIIAYKNLVCRSMWLNPVSEPLGGWTHIKSNGDFTSECSQNFFMFIPLFPLLYSVYREKLIKKNNFWGVVATSFRLSCVISGVIMALRLFLRLGYVRVADFVYQVIGGCIGGAIYYVLWGRKHKGE